MIVRTQTKGTKMVLTHSECSNVLVLGSMLVRTLYIFQAVFEYIMKSLWQGLYHLYQRIK